MVKKVLGKGISALFPMEQGIDDDAKNPFLEIPVSMIHLNPLQPREDMDQESFEEMVLSIKEKGILQPVIVTPSGNGFILIAGERRLKAAKKAGLEKIPAIKRETKDQEMLEIALLENIQREDLNPVDEAKAYKVLIDKFHLSQEELSKRIGKKRATVANTVRLLNLDNEVLEKLKQGLITTGHAKIILCINKKEIQREICSRIIKKGLSVRETEVEINRLTTHRGKIKKTDETTGELKLYEKKLRLKFGTKVLLRDNKGKGKIEILYYTKEDLERILEILLKEK